MEILDRLEELAKSGDGDVSMLIVPSQTVLALTAVVRSAVSVLYNYDWELSEWPEVKALRAALKSLELLK